MAHDVVMPQMGESIAEGTITQWLKKVGDHVDKDAPLFEISTDKVDAEIPAPVAGTLLAIRAQAGETVPIDSVVAVIGAAGEQPAAAGKPAANSPAAATKGPAAAAAAAPPPSAPAAPPPTKGAAAAAEVRPERRSSPLVRKIAAEHGVDISAVAGTGSAGRVTKEDILGHLEEAGSAPPPTTTTTNAVVPAVRAQGPTTAPLPAAGPATTPPLALGGDPQIPEAYRARVMEGDRVEDLTMMRAKIAEHMSMSRRISPHVGTVWEVDLSHVARLRARFKSAWSERHGVNLTYTAFLLKACVEALRAVPQVNASLDGRRAIYHRHVNLGVAVALDWGLIVPVIHRADELNLLGLARHTADLAARARAKKLKPEEVQGGTFTVTNTGVFGAQFSMPVINQPQVGILGVGTVEKRPVVVDDAIAIRTRATLSMSFDHRMLDGALADQFMGRIKSCLEAFDANEL